MGGIVALPPRTLLLSNFRTSTVAQIRIFSGAFAQRMSIQLKDIFGVKLCPFTKRNLKTPMGVAPGHRRVKALTNRWSIPRIFSTAGLIHDRLKEYCNQTWKSKLLLLVLNIRTSNPKQVTLTRYLTIDYVNMIDNRYVI